MHTHPLIPGDPLVLRYTLDDDGHQYIWMVTTWARRTDRPGETGRRAGIPPQARPVWPPVQWYSFPLWEKR